MTESTNSRSGNLAAHFEADAAGGWPAALTLVALDAALQRPAS